MLVVPTTYSNEEKRCNPTSISSIGSNHHLLYSLALVVGLRFTNVETSSPKGKYRSPENMEVS